MIVYSVVAIVLIYYILKWLFIKFSEYDILVFLICGAISALSLTYYILDVKKDKRYSYDNKISYVDSIEIFKDTKSGKILTLEKPSNILYSKSGEVYDIEKTNLIKVKECSGIVQKHIGYTLVTHNLGWISIVISDPEYNYYCYITDDVVNKLGE